MLVLDDPFSALDMDTEREIFDNLKEMCRDSIVLLISHRLSLFPKMDQVIFMEEGKAVVGTHDEMMKMQPEYASLYQVQVAATQTAPLDGKEKGKEKNHAK